MQNMSIGKDKRMKAELQQKLYDKYPKIFRQKDLSMRETCMCWGIDTNDGWYDLIDMLCELLQFNTDRNNYPQVETIQVKEKYGTLRFYYNVIPLTTEETDVWAKRYIGEIEGIVSFAEYLSETICERCGTNQNVTQNEDGWISTLCDKCRKTKQGE